MWQVVGQDRILSLLDYGLRTNAIAHAYLLAGPRHVGKGTLAINLAQALNCDSPRVQIGILSLLDYGLRTNAIAHAYLLAGPRHVGKGTLAINLAQALNCDSPKV